MSFSVEVLATRCFLQKEIQIAENITAVPVAATGMKGEITYVRNICSTLGIPFTRNMRDGAFKHFAGVGHGVLIRFLGIEAKTPKEAIEVIQKEVELACGVLSVLSACPVVLVCAIVQSNPVPTIRFYPPTDPTMRHGTNVPGFLDAVSFLYRESKDNPKLAILLRLFRSAQYEEQIDYRVLHYLILLEEASDSFDGNLSERIRSMLEKYDLVNYVNNLPKELNASLPDGKDFVDVLVRLRHAAAHNGDISPETVGKQYVEPFLVDKERLCNLLREVVRVILASVAGAGPSQIGKRIELKPGESFEICF